MAKNTDKFSIGGPGFDVMTASRRSSLPPLINVEVAPTESVDIQALQSNIDEMANSNEIMKSISPVDIEEFIELPFPVGRASMPFGQVPFGAYLVYGPPNSGKTLTMMALSVWQNAYNTAITNAAVKEGLPQPVQNNSIYYSVSEPRSPNSVLARDVTKLPNYILKWLNQENPLLSKKSEEASEGDIDLGLPGDIDRGVLPDNVTCLTIDSVSLAMRTFNRVGASANQVKTGTMKEGMEVGDQEFCNTMQMAARTRCCLFMTVGSSEVPFVEALVGRVEGMIRIPSPGVIELTFRGSLKAEQLGRSSAIITIPSEIVNYTAKKLLNY